MQLDYAALDRNRMAARLDMIAGPEMQRIILAALEGQTGDLRQLLNAMRATTGDPPEKSA
jgi:hypothetical protein